MSVYLTTLLLGRLSPLTGNVHILLPETDNCPSWISGRERNINFHKRILLTNEILWCEINRLNYKYMQADVLISWRNKNKNSAKGYVAPARERGWCKFTKSVKPEIWVKSNLDTAVWVVIPKCKLIPSITTVAFIVLGKQTWTSGLKLGLTQMLTDWQTYGQMDEWMENQIPISHHVISRHDKNINTFGLKKASYQELRFFISFYII